MSEHWDAVVVGSALVSRIEANPGHPDEAIAEIRQLLGEMRTAMDADLTVVQGLSLHMQALFADAAGPTGKTLSNGGVLHIQ